jgi:pimeloyl-ACP methyl ester carboxylesterase
MALRGIAVLTYDKRGAGKSEGTFERTDNVSAANLELLASDAAAAMRWVSGNSQLRSLPRGFVAISHSGWVIPIALARSPSVDFIGFWSGPACTTSEQLHFQAFSARFEADPNGMSADAIREAMRHVKYRPDDVDPVDRLKAISIPALWLFGGRDPYVPVELSTRRLQDLIDKGRANFQYQVFPEEGHNLADSPEQASFIATVDWINRIASSRTRAC